LPTVRADPDLLGLVFWNLIDNAVKYSPGAADVTVSLEVIDRSLYVHVRDRGMGIPMVEHAHVFQKFARGTAARAASIKGTGIGLAIAREIVRAHGGDITIDSVVGEGSTFSVRLPTVERETSPS
jgi:signal transduction histidine kinase